MSSDDVNEQSGGSNNSDATEDELSGDVQSSREHSERSISPQIAHLDNKGRLAYHKSKWKRLRRNYNDQYLKIFNLNFDQDGYDEYDLDLPTSQHGAVIWNTDEKHRFFQALARHGRHNLPRIAEAIRTKSQIEVKDYMDSLHTAHVNRQLFEKQTKNVSHAEIPAAIEIGGECENSLDEAADALAAFQEQYDVEAGQRQHGDDWLIDSHVASELDVQADKTEEALMETEATARSQELPRHHLFHLTTWLELSERFFMNPSPRSFSEHWSAVAEKGQTPAVTQDVVNAFHALIVSLTQRILQVSIFMAQLRIRSTSRHDYHASRTLTSSDVSTAVDVLQMPQDTTAYWTHYPRRTGSTIVSGSLNKNSKPMSFDEAEAILSVRSRGRRRSMSVSTEGSHGTASDAAESTDQEVVTMEQSGMSASEDIETSTQPVISPNTFTAYSSSSESEVDDALVSTARMDRGQRHELLEEAQDEYMEKVDQKTRAEEEHRLLQLVEGSQTPPIKQEGEGDVGIRPKTLRKTGEELKGWVCTYGAEWERSEGVVPHEEFLNATRGRKRKADDVVDGD